MWPKQEAPYIQSLLEFSSSLTRVNCHDVVSDSELGFTKGWENVRPRAIYRPNKGRRKLKTAIVVTRRCQNFCNQQLPKTTHVMRGNFDDSWNYHYPTATDNGANKTSVPRDNNEVQETAEDVIKETSSNNQYQEQVHIQKLREAIAALVKRDHMTSHDAPTREVGKLPQHSDKVAYRWAVERPQRIGQVMTRYRDKDRGGKKVATIPHHNIALDSDDTQLFNVRRLPIGTSRASNDRTVSHHKILDPTIRYELSQLIQSQLYNKLLLEQQCVNDQLLKVSSALILPTSSSSDHSELQGSHSYPNIATNSRSAPSHDRTPFHKFSLPRKF